jgi:hypothetical protein
VQTCSRCVAVFCKVYCRLCCSMLQCVAVCCSSGKYGARGRAAACVCLRCAAVRCACCSVLQWDMLRHACAQVVLQFVAVCCSVLQRVAVGYAASCVCSRCVATHLTAVWYCFAMCCGVLHCNVQDSYMFI